MRPHSLPFAFGLGGLLTAFQLILAMSLAPGPNWRESYDRLCQWDCRWYGSIAQDGYHSDLPPTSQNPELANVAFFPAYPYLARALHLTLGVDTRGALLIVAQAAAVFFWGTLWLLLMRLRVPVLTALLTLGAIFAHPAAFFLVASYSESLFLGLMLLFILRHGGASGKAQLQAGIAGCALSATRIVGVGAAALPLLLMSRRNARARLLPTLGIAVGSAMGALAFFLFCYVRFGELDLYMDTQRIGWGIVPDYAALLKWSAFQFRYPLDAFITRASGIAFLGFVSIEAIVGFFFKRTGIRRRLPLYLMAFLLFFISVSGLKSVGFQSMIRYSLGWHVLLAICLAHLSLRIPKMPRVPALAGGLVLLLAESLVFYTFQLPHFRGFLHGQWFA